MDKPKKNGKFLSLLATILWVAGFAIPFIVPKNWPFLWLSDALLLIGFWPFLVLLGAWWAWLLLGILNFLIGCVLAIVRYTGDENFQGRTDVIQVKHHLAEYHFEYVWMIIGIISTIVGVVLMIKAIANWIANRKSKSGESK
jgi:UPF0716 family protein affecting phage T7 exclusion